ncbi:MAG: hypothetical protein ACI9MR_000352, partial [Myxococcota bacterium]
GQAYAITDRFTRRPFTLATTQVEGDVVKTPTFAPPSNLNMPAGSGATGRAVDVT